MSIQPDIQNPFSRPIQALWEDTQNVLETHPATWVPAFVMIILLLLLVALWATIGVVSTVGQVFTKQIHQAKRRLQDESISQVGKSGFVISIGVYYLLGLIPWLVVLPFKFLAQIADSTSFEDSDFSSRSPTSSSATPSSASFGVFIIVLSIALGIILFLSLL